MSDQNDKSIMEIIDWPVFILSGGILLVFVVAAMINIDAVSTMVNAAFGFSCKYFGA